MEPTRGGGYRWDAPAVRALEEELVRASQAGLPVILVLHGSPAWAVVPYQADCAPIAPEFHPDFARFAAEAARRYSAPPFNVRFWEIGNEPDAFIFASDSPYGCWGRVDEPLYGGQAFGALLNAVYPAIKGVNPELQVIHGGLLLDRPYNSSTDQGRSARFLEGVLEAGGGRSFDILAFHSYSYYNGTPDGTAGPEDWKPAYLRGLLARYGLTKPLIKTESALLCLAASPECAQAQADAIPRLAVRALRDDLLSSVWYIYDSDSFHRTALLEPTSPDVLRPAYTAFAYAARALGGYRYDAPVPDLALAEGHRLRRGREALIVVWANAPRQVSLLLGQATSLHCAEADGRLFPCVAERGRLMLMAAPAPRYISFLASN
ncbi:MAG: hypothetical protein RMK84_04245 [Oscillochloridaceae bacterium]|nr:hypothetical protein [Chloroflexaceae bacterium]MDW8389313.1 hypothetical protein [Oscillochloridaceae bacterium]